jgi:tetratricopeptide (TPR) repeat protein
MAKRKTTSQLEFLQQAEKATRNGKPHQVLEILNSVTRTPLPRELICPFADIAYRNGFLLLASKLLNPLVRPEAKLEVPATVKEKTIYAATLLYLGSYEEAIEILKQLDPKEDPEILLHRSFALFAYWKYAEAVPLLKKYIMTPSLNGYRRLVGEVNLAAAYVFSHQFEKADALLEELRTKTEPLENRLLHGNCLELSAHLNILKKDFVAAKVFLDQASRVFNDNDSRYAFYVKKGYAIADIMTANGNPKFLENLEKLRQEAVLLKQWESLRDFDMFEALATNNQLLLNKVLIGTPHTNYRKRLADLANRKLHLPSVFKFEMKSNPGKENKTLYISEGIGSNGQSLVRRPVLHLLLEGLFLDLYKPAKLGFLFLHVFPGERFNPTTSPSRLYGAVHNLNIWLRNTETPLHIKVQDGEFHLEATDGLTVFIHRRRGKESISAADLKKLHTIVGGRSFKTIEAVQFLELSKPTIFSLLKRGLKEKRLLKIGQGRSTLYRFISKGIAVHEE